MKRESSQEHVWDNVMLKVIIESPFSGDTDGNIAYAKKCIIDCLKRGESPIASHLLFTLDGILDDTNDCERALGMAAGLAWSDVCDYAVVYTDRGITNGMQIGIDAHQHTGTKILYRELYKT